MNNISVVIPAFKAELLIARTIQSVLSAGVQPENIFVIEDGIFDDTSKVLEQFDGINHIFYEKNEGAPFARNLGLSKVKTKYVMFIDSDDFVSENLIYGLVTAAQEINADITFGPWRYDGDNISNKKIHKPPTMSPQNWIFYWLNTSFVPTCSVLWKTSKVREIGGWNETLNKNQDGDIAIRGLMNTSSLAVSENGYSTYWQHNSLNRISNSSIEDRMYASQVVYDNIIAWLMKNKPNEFHNKELGRFCCKVAWQAESQRKNTSAYSWLSRAENLGYHYKGYDRKTRTLAKILGFKAAVILKCKLLRLLK